MTTVTIQYDENNNSIKQLLSVMRSLGANISRSKKTEKDPTLLSEKEFFDRIDEAKKQVAEGKTQTFSSAEELMAYIETL